MIVPLQSELDALWARLSAEDGPVWLAVQARQIERIRMLQLAESAPDVGEPFPDFVARDAQGDVVTSAALLDRAPLVLVLFRGGWCPFCDLTLRAMDRALDAIRAAGGTLVAICPEPWANLAGIVATKGLRFPVLGDPQAQLAKLCDLHVELSEELATLYREEAMPIEAHHSGGEAAIPVPATFIVDRDAVIRWRFADASWVVRAEPDAVLAALRTLTPPGAA